MDDSLVELLSEEVLGSGMGVPPGTMTLGKLFLSASAGGTGAASAHIYYNGNRIDLASDVDDVGRDFAEGMRDDMYDNAIETIEMERLDMTRDEASKAAKDIVPTAINRIKDNASTDQQKLDAGAEFVSTLLHGDQYERWEVLGPVAKDLGY